MLDQHSVELKSIENSLWGRHTLRVPREDQSVLTHPPLDNLLTTIDENRNLARNADISVQGKPLSSLQKEMRVAVLDAAASYTQQLTGTMPIVGAPETLIVGGHQPALFHTGVWVKNFAINALANRTSGASVNLVVDNDLLSNNELRIPQGPVEELSVTTIPFDSVHTKEPWEEAIVQDRQLFESFAERVANAMQPWNVDPLISEMWPAAIEQLGHSDRLADCLTAARHKTERKWGCENLELPMSRLFVLKPVLWMVYHYLVESQKLHTIHNQVLAEYREVHGVRSQTHPVPELATKGDWLGSPFWIWQRGDQQRKALWVRTVSGQLELSDGKTTFATLPIGDEAAATAAVDEMFEFQERGIRLRPRALSTTLIARMGFADLFVHGIGGAKYDTMTDRIISQFWQCDPPSFMAISGTLQLPLAKPYSATISDQQQLKQKIRDLKYNADRYLGSEIDQRLDDLISEKQDLIKQQQGVRSLCNNPNCIHTDREKSRINRNRFLRLKATNEKLASAAGSLKLELEEELHRIERELAINAMLQGREFSIALFPEEKIHRFMSRIHDMFSSLE